MYNTSDFWNLIYLFIKFLNFESWKRFFNSEEVLMCFIILWKRSKQEK